MEMSAFLLQDLRLLPVLAPMLLLSLTVHEFAHGRVALAFGDDTALRAGRLTLNPLKHLDPVGTAAIFLVGFGWARPVPVNPLAMTNRKTGEIAVSLAGPLSNLAMAILFASILKLLLAARIITYERIFLSEEMSLDSLLYIAASFAMSINILLCVFNLVPLFPLDGHHILRELLPADRQAGFMAWQVKYGTVILMALIFVPSLFENMPDPISEILIRAQWGFEIVFGLLPVI